MKNTSIYLIANILSASIPFLLLPVLTRFLSQEEYGMIAMFQTAIACFSAIVGLSVNGAANRKYYDECSHDELANFNSNCIWILTFSGFITLIFVFVFIDKLESYLSLPFYWLYSAIIISACRFVLLLRLGQWQIRRNAISFGKLQISSAILNVTLSLLLVILCSLGASGRIDAQLWSGIAIAFIALISLKKDNLVVISKPNFEHIKEALSFGMPLIPHVVGGFLLVSADRFVINSELGLSQAGVYMVAFQISSGLTLVFDAINKAFVPWLYDKLVSPLEIEKFRIVKFTYAYFVCLLLIAVASFFVGPYFVVLIAGDEYKQAGEILGLLCVGQIFGGMYLMVTNYIFYSKETGQLSLVTVSSGLVNLILTVIGVSQFGLSGAAGSFCISKFMQFILTWNLANRKYKMPWFDFAQLNKW